MVKLNNGSKLKKMLLKVKIKNFLSIKEEEVIKINNGQTSIIGKNESGKSTILKAIKKLNGEKITKKEKNSSLRNKSLIRNYL